MAKWSLFPAATDVKNSYDLRRTPAKGKVKAVFTSPSVMGCPVHFFNGRTVPCMQDSGCVPCEHGRSYRWMAYFACVDQSDGEHIIYEVTALVHSQLARCDEERGGLRGIEFHAWRPSGRINGRISFLFSKKPKNLDGLPSPPDVPAVMEHIWSPSLDVVVPPNALRAREASPNGRPPILTPRVK